MPEIDETQLSVLSQTYKFTQAALNNPETRAKMLEIQKALNPNVVTEEDIAARHAKPIIERMDAIQKRLDDREKAEADEREKRGHAALTQKVIDGRKMLADEGYTEDGIKKIEEMMETEGVASYSVAKVYYEKLNPPAQPVTASNRMIDYLVPETRQSDDMKPLFEGRGQSQAWENQAIRDALADVRKG